MGNHTDFGAIIVHQERQRETQRIIRELLGMIGGGEVKRDIIKSAAELYDAIGDELAKSEMIMDKVEQLTATVVN